MPSIFVLSVLRFCTVSWVGSHPVHLPHSSLSSLIGPGSLHQTTPTWPIFHDSFSRYQMFTIHWWVSPSRQITTKPKCISCFGVFFWPCYSRPACANLNGLNYSFCASYRAQSLRMIPTEQTANAAFACYKRRFDLSGYASYIQRMSRTFLPHFSSWPHH